jgi:hypothetical protein
MNLKSVFESHWISFLILVPSLVLIGLHEFLGLSDAMLLLRNQHDRDSQLFNFVMTPVILWSLLGCVGHAVYTAHRGVRWLRLKIVVVVVYYLSIIGLFYSRSDV